MVIFFLLFLFSTLLLRILFAISESGFGLDSVKLSIQCANPNQDSRIQFWRGFTSETGRSIALVMVDDSSDDIATRTMTSLLLWHLVTASGRLVVYRQISAYWFGVVKTDIAFVKWLDKFLMNNNAMFQRYTHSFSILRYILFNLAYSAFFCLTPVTPVTVIFI